MADDVLTDADFQEDDVLTDADFMEEPKAEMSKKESALWGGLQGVTGGFADEIGGAGRAGYKTVFGKDNLSDLIQTYQRERDLERQRYKEAEETNPMTFGAANMTGGLATAAIPGVGALKGASTLGKIAGAAGMGGAIGLGMSNADLTKGEFDKAAGDVGEGVLVGGITQGTLSAGSGLAKGVGNVAGKYGDAIRNLKDPFTQGIDMVPAGFGQPMKMLSPVLKEPVNKLVNSVPDKISNVVSKLNKLSSSGPIGAFKEQIAPLLEAAKKGDPSAALTVQLLYKSNPQAMEGLE